jgi:micrococcal nuclease
MSRPARRPSRATLIGVLAPLGLLALAGCSTPATSAAEPTTTTAAPATTAAPDTTTAPTTTAPPTTAPPTTTIPPTTTVPPTTAPPATAAVPATYTVTNVVDGDTVEVTDSAGATARVRLIGVDAPETGACGGEAATMAMVGLVLGKAVTLTPGGDGEDVDRYGRLLRYVDQDDRDAGWS